MNSNNSESSPTRSSKRTRGRAILPIDPDLLAAMLHVPDFLSVRGLTFDPLRNTVILHLEGEALQDVDPSEIPPIAQVNVTTYEDGPGLGRKYWVKWNLPLKPDIHQSGGETLVADHVVRRPPFA